MASTLLSPPQGMSRQQLNDFYDLESFYSSEEKLIRDSVREFVRGEILPGIGDWWQAGHFPKTCLKSSAS